MRMSVLSDGALAKADAIQAVSAEAMRIALLLTLLAAAMRLFDN
jgi:hypothetical protein